MSRKTVERDTHGFTDSGHRDYANRPLCGVCSQIKDHIRHGWPSTPDGARERDAAVLGERGER